MNLIKFDPFLHRNRMPGLIDDFFGRNISDFVGADFVSNVPSVNVMETADGYQLEVAAPGLSKEDFKITMDKDHLTISAEKSTNNETKEGRITRREFNFSSFTRSFVMPRTIEKDRINAKYENGVLILSIPKKAEVVKEEKSRMIEVS